MIKYSHQFTRFDWPEGLFNYKQYFLRVKLRHSVVSKRLMDDSWKLPGNIVASLRHQRAKVYMKGRILPEKKNNKKQTNKQTNKGVTCTQNNFHTWVMRSLKRGEGRRGGGGGGAEGLIPHSRFLFYDKPAFQASVIFITNTVFLPNTPSRDFSESRIPSRHFAFTRFLH